MERKIQSYMEHILHHYDELRDKKQGKNKEFWDAVVISACDENQKFAYEIQISKKIETNQLYHDVPYHVFADPSGYKIGCGGSTMYVLEQLSEIYEDRMYNMRILLIPAGGYSQRLPSLSIFGKLFCPLPFGVGSYHMLDLILATYLPFLENMPPGVFLASSDAIISFHLSPNDSWTFRNEGFTALAHPTPITTATRHGVYVLPENQDIVKRTAFMSDCFHVLQKPSVKQMKDKHAIIDNIDGQDAVFSDSAFFFDKSVIVKLLDFYKKFKPLTCELSSYGDFLSPLGLKASSSYMAQNNEDKNISCLKSELYNTLFGTKLSIMVLKDSTFHHLGTMPEYIDSFNDKNKFSKAFPFQRLTNSRIISCNKHLIKGTILHSKIHSNSTVPESSVLEYCNFSVPITVGENCLISNAYFSENSYTFKVPSNTFLHTVAMKNKFAAITFCVHDDIKKTFDNSYEVEIFGNTFKDILQDTSSAFEPDCFNYSLWTAKLFPLVSEPGSAIKLAIQFIQNICNHIKINIQDNNCISLKDILLQKDVKQTMMFRKKILDEL